MAAGSGVPSLSEVVFFGLRPPKEIDVVHYPAAGRECVRKYLAAIGSQTYLQKFVAPPSPDKALSARRKNLEAQIVAVLGRDVTSEAKAFAGAAPLSAEWEGMSEGPLSEADFADTWLRDHPGSKIAPFVHLYQAHRLRAGHEAAQAEKRKDLLSELSKRYRQALRQARLSAHPLISCIADDLEEQAYVYLEGSARP